MPCYYPIDCWRAKSPNNNGKYPMVFDRKEAQQDDPTKINCGRCIGCKLQKSMQWGLRMEHEATLHKHNCFITLTYNDENLPQGQSLIITDVQKFIKRLRYHLEPQKIRFYLAGEYGNNQDINTLETIGRPHYHVIIFGYEPPDQIFKSSRNGNNFYDSNEVLKIWGKGHVSIGTVTAETAAYVARYTMKKINGDMAETHYQRTNPTTGEITNILPEFATMSRRPGIGKQWFDKYRHDIDKGFITRKGVKMPIPKYYLDLYAENHPYDYEPIKEKKRQSIDPHDPENGIPRLRVKEKIKIKRIKSLKRELTL